MITDEYYGADMRDGSCTRNGSCAGAIVRLDYTYMQRIPQIIWHHVHYPEEKILGMKWWAGALTGLEEQLESQQFGVWEKLYK